VQHTVQLKHSHLFTALVWKRKDCNWASLWYRYRKSSSYHTSHKRSRL